MSMPYPDAERVPSLWFPLAKKFYQAHYPSGKPNKADPIWVIKQKGTILCAVRLKQSKNAQLLTAMVTEPNYRGKGLGSHLLSGIQTALAERSCYCFALTHLVPFYTKNHFNTILAEQLPKDLKSRFYAYTAQGRALTPMRYQQP
ncbi:GNAT family N-acetyltransferase [Marinomonas algarum]|uniref:GNAT family N-acetyltransferase n=1 Tax=Marinomonas algarum TaxID=2883105 RepID=A0A9X1LD49_9GAMM|nr:GNAT family N-acetyltransferase [Marinomonas algarum]MCB5162117.1 GNAT family N-acetyltransferase [Marinomonas algarum]